MPNTKSAIKAHRSSVRKRAYNLLTISKYKDAVKAVRKALLEKKKEESIKLLPAAFKQLDKAAKKRVIHRNKAARLKSRLAKALAKL
ncbi:MAG: 30S ribosomal protein S20 [bacterium]|nr:30S ribosomal protein S20 [bacterium]